MNEQELSQLHREEELEAQLGESETGWQKVKRLCRENKLAAFSALVILLITLAAIFAPLVAPYDPTAQHRAQHHGDQGGKQADTQGDSGPVDHAAEHVTAQLVRAEGML